MHILATIYFSLYLTVRHASEVGLLLFAALGLCVLVVPSMRVRAFASVSGWQKRDTLVAFALSSVFIFKLVSSTWSASLQLGLNNALWHAHFAAWPLVVVALMYCKPKLNHALTALAVSLVITGLWTLATLFAGKPHFYVAVYKINLGVLAELVLVSASLLLVAASTASDIKLTWQTVLYSAGVLGALVILYSTHRRTEWIGFFIVICSLGAWHIRHKLNWFRGVFALTLVIFLAAALIYFRHDRFITAYKEIILYITHFGTDSSAIATSVGARLEMYRLGLIAFWHNPFFGMGAGVRPYLLQAYGGLGEAQLPHRHFHSEYLQTLVEGGIVWATILLFAIRYWFKKAVFEVWATSQSLALLAAYLSISFMLAGSISAGLVYGPANATLVIFSALIWVCFRQLHTADDDVEDNHTIKLER